MKNNTRQMKLKFSAIMKKIYVSILLVAVLLASVSIGEVSSACRTVCFPMQICNGVPPVCRVEQNCQQQCDPPPSKICLIIMRFINFNQCFN